MSLHNEDVVWSEPTPGASVSNRTLGEPDLYDPRRPTAPTAIIGLGNDIASDDGVGIHVARRLASLYTDRPDIEVIALPWAGFALLDALRSRRRAAIVDSLWTGDHTPGTIVRLNEDDYGGSVRLNSFHDISYPTVMALGREMEWDMPDEIAIWGIEAGHLGDFGEELSPAVADAVDRVIHEVILFLGTTEVPHLEAQE